MARTHLVVTPLTMAGAHVAGAAGTADGHDFVNDGHSYIEVANADSNPHDVTFVAGGSSKGVGFEDVTVTIPATATRRFPPLDRGIFNQRGGDDAGKVYIDFESGEEEHFAVAVYRIPS